MTKRMTAYLYVLPLTLFVIAIVALSIQESIKQSFGIFEAIGMTEFTFKYYSEVLCSNEFKTSFLFCLKYAFISSLVSIIIGTCLAFYIKKYKDNFVMKTMKLSIILPHMVVGILIFQIFASSGFLSRLLYFFNITEGMDSFPILLYDKNGIGIMLSYIYKEFCFIAFSFVAVLYRISDEYKNQAYLLGASKISTFFYVTLPMILPNVIYSFIVIFSYSFSSYELPVLLGPSSPKSLATIAYNYYTSPVLQDRPYAMVYNTILILVGLFAFVFFAIFYDRVVKKEATYD